MRANGRGIDFDLGHDGDSTYPGRWRQAPSDQGGGSGFVHESVINGSTHAGSGQTPPFVDDPDRQGAGEPQAYPKVILRW